MDEYLQYIYSKLGSNSDFKNRTLKCNLGTINLLFIDNLCDSKFISEYIITPFILNDNVQSNIESIKKDVIFSNSIGDIKTKEEAVIHILSGDVVIIFDFIPSVIYCEAKGFSKRSITSPITETVLKGPREGFNEAIMDNISLIRRKIKNPDLKVETQILGDKSNTTVALLYIEKVAPYNLVNYVKGKLQNISLDFLLDINYIQEQFQCKHTFFDTIGYTEKPDIASSKILEGRIAILVDGTPFALTAPYFFIENFQMADDYYLNKYYSNFSRVVRIVAFIISLSLPGIYVALTTYHFSLIPLEFIFRLAASRADVPLPLTVEVLLMTFFFVLLREAGIRLPQPIGQAMSIVGALILGDAAVGAGLASQSTVIIVALSAITSFLVPKLNTTMILWELIIILLSSLLGLMGFFTSLYLFCAHLGSLNSCGYPYFMPLTTSEQLDYKDLVARDNLNVISQNILHVDKDEK
ncbi:spore germination protein [Clostridium sp. PL3]|uniref:Spore germination protein n=1 Tax=Clostridium thailandense TaxID=2794346 RepID=A0A949TXS0_9CLOT|nr:spore germination protein [Clostridium thailandense]MBV7275531.1 spore germination protein [Clostridium thailandense]